MYQHRRTVALSRAILLLSANVLLAITVSAQAQDNGTTETAELSALIRQLALIDDITLKASDDNAVSTARYRFDYARLHADLARIRQGIEDYLAPSRAQPRDPSAITGDYRLQMSNEQL